MLSSQSVKKFHREIKPLVSEYYDILGRLVSSRCNDAVGNMNSTEKFHWLVLRFLKIVLQCVGKWLLAETMPNFTEQWLPLLEVME